MKKLFKNIILLFIVSLFIQGIAFAQFGKNKVQYKYFEWYYIQTKHFDIYFTDKGETLAEFTAHAAEEALESLQKNFDYAINNRLTLIVYNSQNDFQETNVTDYSLSEGISGFTELFKNRVVVQFAGSYKDFRHLIHHELVHAVMNDMYYGGSIQNIISNNITLQVPLWFSEGLAEYLSLGWDVETDMFIRDAIISENLPDIPNLSGYFAYRGGQAVFYYIAKKYGEEKVSEIIHAMRSAGNPNGALQQTIGLDVKKLNERWKKDIKRTFWPDIAIREDPDEFAKRLTDPEKSRAFFNTRPTLSPQGDKIAFITNRDFFFSVYIMNANDGSIIKRLAKGNVSPNFEELNILSPGITWSPDGKKLAVSALSRGYDLIYVFNVETDDYYTLPIKLDGIQSITWSRDGEHLAFIGQTPKQTDLYIYNFETGTIKNLTNDIFSDSDPCWSIDGTSIYFVSDRNNYLTSEEVPDSFKIYKHDYSQTDIYSIIVETGLVTRITDMPNSSEVSPVVSEDGKSILFISDLNGINNIYKKRIVFSSEDNYLSDIKDIKPVPVTNSLTGISQLSTTYDGKKLAFTSLYKSSYNIFLLNNPFETDIRIEELLPTKFREGLLDLEISPNKLVRQQSGTAEALEDSVARDSIPFYTGEVIDTIRTYGDSVRIDFGSYVFGPDVHTSDSLDEETRRELFELSDNLDSLGRYKVHRYKINFSPDIIYANAGYNTLYGLTGNTIISFSDVLGNHRLVGITGLQIDLKNSDYGLAYYYLAKRIDWGIQGYHTARFVRLARIAPQGFIVGNLFRFRNFGAVGSMSYPLNRFYRFDTGLSWLNVSSENLDDISEPPENVSFLVPSASFVHDNVLWGYTAPIEGTRYRFDVFGNVGIGNPNQRFYSMMGDLRTYLRFFTDHSLALRLSTGFSNGPNPQRFFIGGIENWINRTFATTEVPIESASDFAFLTAVLPLRGYNYSEQIGTRYFITNFELRFPVIRYLLTGGLPLLFSNIIGVGFVDIGSAWNNNSEFKPFGRNESGNFVTNDLLMGTGFGARLYVLYFLLRFDIAWAYDLDHWSKPKFYFSLGADF
jgi:Tol biopolymer transport system component